MNRRKPEALKELQGTTRADRQRLAPGFTRSEGIRFPKQLKGNRIAVIEFKRVAFELEKAGVLMDVDSSLLEEYALTYSRWRASADEINQNGLTLWIESPNKTRKLIANPAIRIEVTYAGLLLKQIAKLGISPADRMRVEAAPVDEDDPLQRFLAKAEAEDRASYAERWAND